MDRSKNRGLKLTWIEWKAQWRCDLQLTATGIFTAVSRFEKDKIDFGGDA